MDDFLEWLAGPDRQCSEQALFEVMDALENSSVQPSEKVIVWADGQRLSITETARRIHSQSDLPFSEIESYIIGWLEMHYEPEGLTEQQMEQFENMIDNWIDEHHQAR